MINTIAIIIIQVMCVLILFSYKMDISEMRENIRDVKRKVQEMSNRIEGVK